MRLNCAVECDGIRDVEVMNEKTGLAEIVTTRSAIIGHLYEICIGERAKNTKQSLLQIKSHSTVRFPLSETCHRRDGLFKWLVHGVKMKVAFWFG